MFAILWQKKCPYNKEIEKMSNTHTSRKLVLVSDKPKKMGRHETQHNDIQPNNKSIETLSIIALEFVMPSAIMLNVVYVECHK
jgi:hypothetical protein